MTYARKGKNHEEILLGDPPEHYPRRVKLKFLREQKRLLKSKKKRSKKK